MKYTLEGFNQETALNLTKEIKKNDETKTIRLDIIDLVLLRWFVDFFPNMKKNNVNGIEYAWVNYSSVVEELPILYIQKKSVYERFEKMCDLGILVHHFDKNGECYSYYGFGKNYTHMISKGKQDKRVCVKEEKYKEIIELYNHTCVSLPNIRRLNNIRRYKLDKLLKIYNLEDFKKMFENVEKAPFLRGLSSNSGWRAHFDWLIIEENFIKVLEGAYENMQ